MPALLSRQTRIDSFSDYLAITAYQANTLQSRANVARGRGESEELKLSEWYVPMPKTITRNTVQNFAQSETSLGYAIQKYRSAGGSRGFGTSRLAANAAETALNSGILGAPAAAAIIGLTEAVSRTFDAYRSVASQLTDQPLVSLSNHEMRYSGTSYRSYKLDYVFVARDSKDVYGPSGILTYAAQLEAYSYPISYQTASNRDLVGTPPVWTIKHALVDSETGSLSLLPNQDPLSYLGQPRLLYLNQVIVQHDNKSVVVDDLGYTYPMKTGLTLNFTDMEPLVRVSPGDPSDYRRTDPFDTAYGNLVAPRLATRSEIYTIDDGWDLP